MKIRPSSLPRLAACPASFRRVAQATVQYGPEPENEAMARGQAVHAELATIVMNHGLCGLQDAKDDLNRDITVRVLAGRAWYTLTTLEMVGPACHVGVEKHLPSAGCLAVSLKDYPFEGTADLIVWNRHSRRIVVLDYKSGFAIQSEAWEHPQLVCYAVLAMMSAWDLLRESVSLDRDTTVFGQIVSPVGKLGVPLRVDKTNLSDAYDQLTKIARECETENLQPEPGKHCAWCWAAGKTCDAFRNTVSESLVVLGKEPRLPSVPDETLVDAYAKAKQLAALQDALGAEIKRRIHETGKPCAGYTIKTRKGTVKLAGDALVEACVEWGVTAADLGIAVNIKDMGNAVAAKLKVKKIDGLNLVEAKYGSRAVHADGAQALVQADEETTCD